MTTLDRTQPDQLRRFAPGQLVKVVCNNCQREDFSSIEDFLNHCRILHKVEYGSHDTAINYCGRPINRNEAATLHGSLLVTSAHGKVPVIIPPASSPANQDRIVESMQESSPSNAAQRDDTSRYASSANYRKKRRGPACQECRSRKRKCEGSQPCSFCSENDVACIFGIQRKEMTPPGSIEEAAAVNAAQHGGPNRLRYNVVLNAPTAMVKHEDEIPLTYSNKGQTYLISVVDSVRPPTNSTGACYRSYVRISFDDEQQRSRPEACWQLWAEGRGAAEAHNRGGRLQAIEPLPGDEPDALSGNADVEIESIAHDGFSVLSYSSGAGPQQYLIPVRFNFLSTDFSHSKGIKGVPVRLCVKTEMRSLNNSEVERRTEDDVWDSEVCYCKIKLFRDHGSERKLANDVAHVKKSIEKLKQQIAVAERSSNSHRTGKRKRSVSEPPQNQSTIESNMPVASNVATDSSPYDNTPYSPEPISSEKFQGSEDIDDFNSKLATLQDMLISTHPESVLNLRGEDHDDPDEYPLQPPKERANDNDDSRWTPSGGSRGRQSPASLHSQSSRGSSPPRASSIGASGGHITPNTIPFQPFQDELYRPFLFTIGQPQATTSTLPVNEYRYTAIRSEEVRLMVLYPARFDEAVSCGLKILPLHRLEGSQLVYQALSYAWGDETAQNEIGVEDVAASFEQPSAPDASDGPSTENGSRKLYVRPNLYAALKRLRSESEELWFWIDAICIDQENLKEKGHQLPKMLDIYCNAWSVCVWLGEAEHPISQGSCEPFDLIATIINLKLLDHIVEADSIDEQTMLSLIGFAKLLKRPWFRRRWVIQEISSSTRASVQHGGKKVNWIDFADAIQLFALKLDRIRALYHSSKLFQRDPDALSHVEAAGASAIVRATTDVLRKGEDGRIISRLCDIETLVMRFVHFEASDPHDTVFALWPLAEIKTQGPFPGLFPQLKISPTSYLQICEKTYIDFVFHCIEIHGSLDIICRHWALPLDDPAQRIRPHRMRSWIGTTASSAFGMHLESGGRMNGDSIVGLPGHKLYDASMNRLPDVYQLQNRALGTMLCVKGCVVSRVSRVSPRVVDGTIPYDTLKLLGWTDRNTVDTISDRVWRTLVADCTFDGNKAPSWWRRACMFALSLTSRDGDLNTQKLLQNKSLPQTVHEYLRRVQAMVWNRRLFALESAAPVGKRDRVLPTLVGLGPRDAQEGDFACVLMGCSVPVIVHKVPFSDQHDIFELVGECYIHGMMEGAALDSTPSDAWSSMKVFKLM